MQVQSLTRCADPGCIFNVLSKLLSVRGKGAIHAVSHSLPILLHPKLSAYALDYGPQQAKEAVRERLPESRRGSQT